MAARTRITAFLALAAGIVAAAESSGVPPARLGVLGKGINLSHWFAQGPRDYPRAYLESYDTAADMALIRSLGFLHVRWTFDQATVQASPGKLDPEKLKIFDAALDMMLAADLAVIVDFHPGDEYKRAVEKDDAAADAFVAMWAALAAHLSSRNPERVFFEAMNEPVIKDAARWNAIQGKALAAMRAAAPRHTLIASGAQWSSVDQLLLLEPVPDPNVVYNFHCYEPFAFTHQSAGWVGDPVKSLKDVPYPSSPEAVARAVADAGDDRVKDALHRYGEARWNAETLEALVARAAAWGAERKVPLTCNEFGVYRRAPAADRARCLADVRTALEKHGIGWCMWDYAGGFAVAQGKPGARVADPDTVTALGLAMPAAVAQPPKHAAPKIAITLDATETPDLAAWAAKAKQLCEESYPMLLTHLGAEGFTPPAAATLIFKKANGIAWTSGTTITCAEAWFKAHPDDYGAVIHELCHVVQAYGRSRVPGWVTEGIADYVRWFCWEPAERRPRVNVRRAKYTDSYQTTAAFFDWIVRAKDKTFVTRLNAACRTGKYKPELFTEYAGNDVDALWAEFIGSLEKK